MQDLTAQHGRPDEGCYGDDGRAIRAAAVAADQGCEGHVLRTAVRRIVRQTGQRHIVDLQLAKLGKLLADRKLGLEVTPEARAYLAELGYDPIYGARPLKRVVQQRLQNPIALEVLEGHFPEGSTIRVVRKGDELTFSTTDGSSERPGA